MYSIQKPVGPYLDPVSMAIICPGYVVGTHISKMVSVRAQDDR